MSRTQKLSHDIVVLAIKLDRLLASPDPGITIGDQLHIRVGQRGVTGVMWRDVAKLYVMPGDVLNAAPPKRKARKVAAASCDGCTRFGRHCSIHGSGKRENPGRTA